MSGYTTLRAPASDAHWARDIEDRIGQLENPTSARVGNWVLNDVEGMLVATSPGNNPITLGGFSDLDLGILGLSDFVTQADLTHAIAGIAAPELGDLLNGFFDGIPILDQLVEAITGAVGGLSDLTAFFESIPVIGDFVEAITGILGGNLGDLTNFFGGFDGGVPLLGQLVEAFTGVAGGGLPELTSWVGGIPLLADIVEALTGVVGGGLPDLTSWAGDIPLLSGIVEAITGVTGGGLPDLTSWAADIPLLSDIVEAITGIPGGGLTDLTNFGPLGFNSPLNALNLFGMIPDNVLGLLPLSHIADTQPNLLTAPSFDDPANLEGSSNWVWDGAVGRTTPGSAKAIANSTDLRLVSNVIPVVEGQTLDISVFVKWSGLSFTGTPIKLQVRRFLNNAPVATDDLASPSSPGANQAAWLFLTNTYTVPAGCNTIRVQFYVAATTTAGSVWWDDADAHKTGLLEQGWVDGLPDALTGLLGNITDLGETIFEAITGGTYGGTNLLPDLLQVLQNIPFLNIAGLGGPPDIGGSVQNTWDQWIGGLVGEVGTGASLADLFNIGQQISSLASLGGFAWDILGIRTNKAMDTGFLSTSHSNIPLSKIGLQASPPTFGITQGAAPIAFERIQQSMPIGVVRWHGSGNTNLDDFRVNIWKMDTTTGAKSLVHRSANIIGDIAPANAIPQRHSYSLPTPLAAVASEVYGFELAPLGSGTHNVAGTSSWVTNDNVFPRNYAAVRAATPVTFDAVGGGDSDSVSGTTVNSSWSHTCTGSERAVVVMLDWGFSGAGSGATTRTVTYDGVAMTSQGYIGANNIADTAAGEHLEVFTLLNPPTGTKTVAVTVTRTGVTTIWASGNSVSYTGCAGIGAVTNVSGTEVGTSLSQTVSSITSERIVQGFITTSGAIGSYSQTQRYADPGGGRIKFGGANGAASVNFTATRAADVDYAGLAVRLTPTGTPPSSIPDASITYGANVPFIEFGVTATGGTDSHDPLTVPITATGTTPIPSWANFVEVIAVGAGGGGHVGSTWPVYAWGEGGDAGVWAVNTWERDVDFDDTVTVVSVTIGTGGAHSNGGANGHPGGNTVVSITGHTVTANGGAGGDTYVYDSTNAGDSPGNQSYGTPAQPYVGGVAQSNSNADGNVPGGGGAGGDNLFVGSGGVGARGGAWLRFRQE